MIRLRGVGVRLGGRWVLRGLDLDLPVGVVAVTGPNGVGKTTLGRVLLGLVVPDEGEVRTDGCRRAAVFQEDRLCPHLDAVANVRLVLPRDVTRDAVRAELADLGLPDEAHDRPVRELSGGQRRRVAIARALLTDAPLVVLDEPLTGIDEDARGHVLDRVAQACAGRHTLLVSHDARDAERLGARLVGLADGTLVP
ncbi:ABC transporter ATP-binding protein [Cellulomonas composti]|uniref:Sulfate transporter n=1 Tax=Cellulomonas composti TaxID=266130 RepID=A0A511J7J6_9CELL|nr:ABC transporter ATP-binding protein [Cellulomonas composti]GEL93967.1 sulfate transporter [Cellulomonas composti]